MMAQALPTDCTLDWKPGKQGIASAHRQSLAAVPSRSADLDKDFERCHPNENRWDYLCERKAGTIAAVEVHQAKPSEVKVMIAKKEWAQEVADRLDPPLSPDTWHWVLPPGAGSQLSKTTAVARQLAAAGIEAPVRKVLAGRL